MRIIFMGTPDFAVPSLEALVDAGHEVVLAVTQPDKQRGRGQAVTFSPVKETALKYDIPVIQPERIRDQQWIDTLGKHQADVYVVAAFGQILPKEILSLPRFGCLNVHASLLPKYRGALPIQWSIMLGDKETGVTIMQMEEGLDTGDMLSQVRVPIALDDTGGSLHDKLAAAGAKLLVETLEHVGRGDIEPRAQDDSQSSYVGMLGKELGRIDWSQDAVSIERRIRGLNPWPSAFTTWNGRTLKLWEASVVEEHSREPAKPGSVVRVLDDAIDIQTGRGILRVSKLQLEGRKRMDAAAFLRGNRVQEQMQFGEDADE